MPPIVRALRHRNYRLYFSGQVVSLIGTWMQQVAIAWLAYRLTGSALMLGLVGFASQIPILLLAPIGGLLSDRVDRRRLLLATQGGALAQALVLTVLTLAGLIVPWHLVALALALGMLHAIDIPARQSYFAHLVADRDDLPNAIALNSFAMNTARLVGPALGGLTVALVGEAACFLLNAASYLAVLLALAAIDTASPAARPGAGGLAALAEGFRAAFGEPPIRALLALVACISFFATPYSVLMPAFVGKVLGGDARILGWMLSCAGGGAVLGTLVLASRESVTGLERTIAAAAVATGAALMAFSATRSVWLAAPALVLVGFGIISVIASSNTVIQTLVADEVRGRVMAVFTMCFLGVSPLGALAGGAAAEALGAQTTLACGGALALCAGLWFAGRRAQVGRALAGAASRSKGFAGRGR